MVLSLLSLSTALAQPPDAGWMLRADLSGLGPIPNALTLTAERHIQGIFSFSGGIYGGVIPDLELIGPATALGTSFAGHFVYGEPNLSVEGAVGMDLGAWIDHADGSVLYTPMPSLFLGLRRRAPRNAARVYRLGFEVGSAHSLAGLTFSVGQAR